MGSFDAQFRHLDDLLKSGAVTEEEFHKTKLLLLQLETPADDTENGREQLETELARIDEEWAVEQRRYYVDHSGEGEPPDPQPPNAFRMGFSVVVGLTAIGFGIWILWPLTAGPIALGLFVSLVGIWFPVQYRLNQLRYRRAGEAYQRRRAAVLEQIAALGGARDG
jgi:hypothetical protein